MISSSVAEEARNQLDASIDTLINDFKGSISTNSESKRRALAYPIAKQRVGFVRVVQASVDPATISKLQTEVAKLNGVVRVSVLQTAARTELTAAIFDSVAKQQTAPKKVTAEAPKPATPMSAEEVSQKIDKALDEEVK